MKNEGTIRDESARIGLENFIQNSVNPNTTRAISGKDDFQVPIEKGEAAKSVFEMSLEEIQKVSDYILDLVTKRAAEIGQKPVTTEAKNTTRTSLHL